MLKKIHKILDDQGMSPFYQREAVLAEKKKKITSQSLTNMPKWGEKSMWYVGLFYHLTVETVKWFAGGEKPTKMEELNKQADLAVGNENSRSSHKIRERILSVSVTFPLYVARDPWLEIL